jgi:hypothetical protein
MKTSPLKPPRLSPPEINGNRDQRSESRKQKAEGRKQKTEGQRA